MWASIPLFCSFSALLVAWRDLKPFLCCFVVLRWWWFSATEGAMLPLPPALNLKGIDDATLTAMRQKCCASAPGAGQQNRGSTLHFPWPAKLIRIDKRYLSAPTTS